MRERSERCGCGDSSFSPRPVNIQCCGRIMKFRSSSALFLVDDRLRVSAVIADSIKNFSPIGIGRQVPFRLTERRMDGIGMPKQTCRALQIDNVHSGA